MKTLFPISGYVCLFVLIGYKASLYGKRWECGPKYNMPVALLSPDGQRFADGTPLDPLTVATIRSGREEEIWLGAAAVWVFGLLWIFRVVRQTERIIKDSASLSLDDSLMGWNGQDRFTRRHLLNGGVLILGRPGSGKTSGSGMMLGRSIAGDTLSSMLILCAKPEDAAMWQRIYREKNRELLVFEPGGKLRCNMLEFIQRMGGDTREIVSFILTASEALRGESNQGSGEYGNFFQDEERRYLHHAVEILRQAGVGVSAPTLQRFISGAAISGEQLASEAWREDFHNQCLRAAASRQKNGKEQHDFELARDAWVKEWPVMATRTRSCVLAGMLNKLFYFNSGIARELLSTSMNCSPLDLLNGKSILVNCPACEHGDSGALISTAWKYLVQKTILSREFKPGDFYNVIWADEAWQVTTSFDQHFAATSRSHGGAMVYLVQSRDSFYSALKGEDGKHFANTLIGMFHHKIFHALGSAEDAEYASSLLGQHRESLFSASAHPSEDIFDAVWGRGQVHGSFSESYQPVVQPNVFMNGLRCGGRENKGLVDAIVIRSGEPFHSGENFIFTCFQQR